MRSPFPAGRLRAVDAPGATVMGVRVVVAGAQEISGREWHGRSPAAATRSCLRAGGPASISCPATGLEAVLAGADAVVHCADDTSRGDGVTVYGTRRLADAAADRGCTSCTSRSSASTTTRWPTTAASCAPSRASQAAGGPATVLRATQFHSLAAYFARTLQHGTGHVSRSATWPSSRSTPTRSPSAWPTSRWVPARRHTRGRRDLAGPDVLTVGEHRNPPARAPRRLGTPGGARCRPLGGTLRAFAAAANVPDGGRRRDRRAAASSTGSPTNLRCSPVADATRPDADDRPPHERAAGRQCRTTVAARQRAAEPSM